LTFDTAGKIAYVRRMAKKAAGKSSDGTSVPASSLKASAFLDTRVLYCGDKVIFALTIQEILDEHIAKNLA
jgi:hypothetical protein